jgi:menaquinol-cytochrome c reductase iron-sulfur subunit
MDESGSTKSSECVECRQRAVPPPDASITDRRGFLGWTSVALGGLAALLAGVPVLGALFSPVRRDEPDVWRTVGTLDDFSIGETVMVRYRDPDALPWAGFAGRSGAWLRRETAERFVAFSPYCTHVGCPVTWSAGARKFFCPCHGGTYHQDGRVAAGPPPRPLEQLAVRVRDGHVELRTMGAPLTG